MRWYYVYLSNLNYNQISFITLIHCNISTIQNIDEISITDPRFEGAPQRNLLRWQGAIDPLLRNDAPVQISIKIRD